MPGPKNFQEAKEKETLTILMENNAIQAHRLEEKPQRLRQHYPHRRRLQMGERRAMDGATLRIIHNPEMRRQIDQDSQWFHSWSAKHNRKRSFFGVSAFPVVSLSACALVAAQLAQKGVTEPRYPGKLQYFPAWLPPVFSACIRNSV